MQICNFFIRVCIFAGPGQSPGGDPGGEAPGSSGVLGISGRNIGLKLVVGATFEITNDTLNMLSKWFFVFFFTVLLLIFRRVIIMGNFLNF